MVWMEKMVWCGYLGWLSLCDIRKRAIPLWMLSAGGLPVLLGLLRNGWNISVITALLPGALLLLLSVLTDTVGKADGIILMLLGSVCTDGRIWLLLCLSLIYIFLYSMFLYISKKDPKRRIPYIPFLLIAYITTWIL